MEILKLLSSKNKCLERILTCTKNYLDSHKNGEAESLFVFERKRESIFKAVTLFNGKILTLIKSSGIQPFQKEEIKRLLTIGDQLTEHILIQDKTLLSLIEREKGKILEELKDAQKYNRAVCKFKSKWVTEPGEQLDGTI